MLRLIVKKRYKTMDVSIWIENSKAMNASTDILVILLQSGNPLNLILYKRSHIETSPL